jgi:hypothetical protein
LSFPNWVLTLNVARRRHILGFEAEGRRSSGKAGMGGRIHHRREIFAGREKAGREPGFRVRGRFSIIG